GVRGHGSRRFLYTVRRSRGVPAARPAAFDLFCIRDLHLRFDRDALDREPDRGCGNDGVLLVAVRGSAQTAVPALAELLLSADGSSCRNFSRTFGWVSTSRPARTTSCSVCSVRWSALWWASCRASARLPPLRCCCRSPSVCRRSVR